MDVRSKITIAIIAGGIAAAIMAVVGLSLLFSLAHGTIEAKGFCGYCHTQYYDTEEYAFNENMGMKKPKGVLGGCAECHPQPYREFKESAHFDTDLEEQRPGCANCHEPHSFSQWLDYMYFSPPEWKKVRLSLHDNSLWEEEVRPDLAQKARKTFVVNKSKFCKDCHVRKFEFKYDIKAHKKALGKVDEKIEDVICVACHYNFVHAEVDWDDKNEDIEAWLKDAD